MSHAIGLRSAVTEKSITPLTAPHPTVTSADRPKCDEMPQSCNWSCRWDLGRGESTWRCVFWSTSIADPIVQRLGLLFLKETLATATFLRSLAGFGFSLLSPTMCNALGYGKDDTILAAAAIALGCPAPWLLWFYGERIRNASRLLAKDSPRTSASIIRRRV